MIIYAIIIFILSLLIPYFIEGKLISPVSILWGAYCLPIFIFNIDLSLIFYVYSIFSFLVYTSFYYLSLRLLSVYSKNEFNYKTFNHKYVKRFVMLSFLFCALVFVFNISGVFLKFGFNAYTYVSSKDIELTFGRSTVLNYLFFFNMVLPCFIYYFILKKVLSKFWYVSIFMCFIFLSMTGIKSTLLFGLTIYIFFFILNSNKVGLIKYIVIGLTTSILVYLMFFFVNIGVDSAEGLGFGRFSDLLYGYIGINYRNLDLELNSRVDYMFGKYTFIFITKLFDSSMQGGYFASNELILIDPNFNMGTFLREYFVDYGFIGSQVIIVLIAFFGAFFYKLSTKNIGFSYCLSVYYAACAFSFFGNQFIRLQFIVISMQALVFVYFILYSKKVGE